MYMHYSQYHLLNNSHSKTDKKNPIQSREKVNYRIFCETRRYLPHCCSDNDVKGTVVNQSC